MVTNMFCMRCGQEMPDSLNFCTNCGNDLSASRAAVNAAGAGIGTTQQMPRVAPAAQPNMQGQPIAQPAYPGQGAQQVRPIDPAMAAGRVAAPQAAPQSGSNKTVPIIIAVAVVAALVLAAVAYFAVGGTKDDAKPTSTTSSNPSSGIVEDDENSQATKQPSSDETEEDSQEEVPVASGAPRFSTLSASSVLTGDIDSHQPDCLVDGDTTTAWCEGVSGAGEGEWVEFNADMKQNVRSIRIMAGFNKSEDLYWKNSRPKDITITFDDGTTTTSTLSDEPFAWHTITLSETVQTSSVRITIDSTYPGSRYTDTCISEITIQ